MAYFKSRDDSNPVFVRACFEGDQVRFSNAGGGFVHVTDRVVFNNGFAPATAQDWEEHIRPKNLSAVGLDDGPDYPCYISDQRWNGWAMPAFPAVSALAVAKDNNDGEYTRLTVLRNGEELAIEDVDELQPQDAIQLYDLAYPDEPPECIQPKVVNGEPTWGVGAGRWIWSEVVPEEDEDEEWDLDDQGSTPSLKP